MNKVALYRNQGQSLFEYVLAGSAIVLVAIGGLMLVGGQLNNRLSGLQSDLGINIAAASASNPQASDTTSGTESGTATLTITLSSGRQIQVSNYPLDPSLNVQTSGTNGYTGLLANNLSSLADELLKSGELTQDQSNILIALANQGHQIAEIEQLIENAAQQAGIDSVAFQNTQIQYNGTTYATPLDLAKYYLNAQGIDYVAGHDNANFSTLSTLKSYDLSQFEVNGTIANTGIAVGSFVQLYQMAKTSGALSDPTLDLVISALSLQITKASDAMSNQLYMDSYSDPSVFSDYQISTLTNSDAADICSAGSGTDSGISCQ